MLRDQWASLKLFNTWQMPQVILQPKSNIMNMICQSFTILLQKPKQCDHYPISENDSQRCISILEYHKIQNRLLNAQEQSKFSKPFKRNLKLQNTHLCWETRGPLHSMFWYWSKHFDSLDAIRMPECEVIFQNTL